MFSTANILGNATVSIAIYKNRTDCKIFFCNEFGVLITALVGWNVLIYLKKSVISNYSSNYILNRVNFSIA